MSQETGTIRLFLCGDVMTGRGIDQILPYPENPKICESFAGSAMRYVELAERANGRIPRPVAFSYIWGDVLDDLASLRPAVRIVNLETSITDRGECMPKGINYRMSRRNVPCLTAAGIAGCVLANNHVLDWGYEGLDDTLDALAGAGIKTAGAGSNYREAGQPATIETAGQARIIVLGLGVLSSGIPQSWRATEGMAGVNLAADLSQRTVAAIASRLRPMKGPGDILVVSIHWGGNWGYGIPASQVRFAHALIDEAGVDIVHGHSSHHAKAIEVYKGRLILYGCGDFINDYEGIRGHEAFRGDLVLAYLPSVSRAGHLAELQMIPFRSQRFRLARACREDVSWLAHRLSGEGERFRTRVYPRDDGALLLGWW